MSQTKNPPKYPFIVAEYNSDDDAWKPTKLDGYNPNSKVGFRTKESAQAALDAQTPSFGLRIDRVPYTEDMFIVE